MYNFLVPILKKILGVGMVAVVIAGGYFIYIRNQFVQVYGWNKLGITEKKSILASENAFYYSFYQQLAEADTNKEAFGGLLNDTRSEYPDKVNDLRLYNIMPEVVLGATVRILSPIVKVDEMNFYITAVLVTAAVVPAIVFIMSVALSGGSILGGLVSVMVYLMCFSRATRVVGGVALRENFALPWVMLTILGIISWIKSGKVKFWWLLISVTFSLWLWQFSIIILTLILISALLLLKKERADYLMRVVSLSQILVFLLKMGDGAILSSILMLMTISYWAVRRWGKKLAVGGWRTVFGSLALAGMGWFLVGNSGSEGHVFGFITTNIFGNSGDFFTKLYSCSPSFSRMDGYTWGLLFKSGLLPLWIAEIVIIVSSWRIFGERKQDLFWALVSGEMMIIAIFSVRFSVIAIPIAAAGGGILVGQNVFRLIGLREGRKNWLVKAYKVLLFSLIGGLFVGYGIPMLTLKNKQSYINNNDLIDLLTWIESSTAADSVWSGGMQLMSSIRLLGDRRITNNPFFEAQRSREKNLMVYRMYSGIGAVKMNKNLRALGGQYYVLEKARCYGRSATGCSMSELFINDPENVGLPLCRVVGSKENYFESIYQNNSFSVLRIK